MLLQLVDFGTDAFNGRLVSIPQAVSAVATKFIKDDKLVDVE